MHKEHWATLEVKAHPVRPVLKAPQEHKVLLETLVVKAQSVLKALAEFRAQPDLQEAKEPVEHKEFKGFWVHKVFRVCWEHKEPQVLKELQVHKAFKAPMEFKAQ